MISNNDMLFMDGKNMSVELQYQIGMKFYYDKIDIHNNIYEAKRWFKLAAKNGHPSAQFNLGYMYYVGEGTKIDYMESLKWFKKASDQGDISAKNYNEIIVKKIREEKNDERFMEALKIYDHDRYKLEIRSLEKNIK